MTGTAGDIGMHDLRRSGRGVSASRARDLELVAPPLKSQGAGLSRWAPPGEPPAA